MFAANPYIGGAYMLANGANRMRQGQYDWHTGMDLGFGLMPFGNQISRGFKYAWDALPMFNKNTNVTENFLKFVGGNGNPSVQAIPRTEA